MSKRTYKEAVEITVNWWGKKSFNTSFNQDNGDDSKNRTTTFVLMNMMSQYSQEKNTPDKIEKFKIELTKLLLGEEGKPPFYNELSVDYHPNRLLALACELSDIDSGCLPCKTFTCITTENEVEGRYQYRGDFFKL